VLPTASLVKSATGKLAYGLPDRLCLRPHHSSSSQIKSSALWTPRQPRQSPAPPPPRPQQQGQPTVKPILNRRHDPYAAYITSLKEREKSQGLDRQAVSVTLNSILVILFRVFNLCRVGFKVSRFSVS